MDNANKVKFITVSTRDYLPAVAVLADSLRRHHPEHKLTCYLVEDSVRAEDCYGNRLEVIGIDNLHLPNKNNFLFQYTALELCCALKPFCIMDQLERHRADYVVYLDGDMFVCAPFLDIISKEWQTHEILFTPHLHNTEPDIDYGYFLKSGFLNSGFVAVKNTEKARKIILWWQNRLEKECIFDHLGGRLSDQNWLDFTASIFNAKGNISHHGINVGHWNLHECDFRESNGQIMVSANEPLCIFHFSSFKNPGLTKHKSVFKAIPPEVQRLAGKYEIELNKMRELPAGSFSLTGDASYSFDKFKNGTTITQPMREAVRLGLVNVDNPFDNRDKIAAALPADDPGSILDSRIDHLVYRLQEKCNIQKRQLNNNEEELRIAHSHMRRIRKHPVIGRIMSFWNRFINKNTLAGFPEN